MSCQEIFRNLFSEQLDLFRSINHNFKTSMIKFLRDNEVKILVLPHRWNGQLAAMKVERVLKKSRELAILYGTSETYMSIRWGGLFNSLNDTDEDVPRLPNILVIELDDPNGLTYLTSIVERVHTYDRKKLVFTWSTCDTQIFDAFINMFKRYTIYKMDIHGNVTTIEASIITHDSSIENWFNAVNSGNIERMTDLCERSVNIINVKEIDTDNTALHIAVLRNDSEMVNMLLTRGARHLLNNKNLAPLHLAAKKGYPSVLISLLDNNNIDKNVKGGKRDYTPLHYAAFTDNALIISSLVEHGADLNVRSSDGFTPLHCACHKNNMDSVQRLLLHKKRLDINARGTMGSRDTALHGAVKKGHLNIIKILIKNGADTSIKNGAGMTPIEVAPPGIRDEVLAIFNRMHV
ncbi:putative ankyrin repeat protein RF_0580 [Euwallacea fornicatus]|uniref:putative ankyrin repeat protein RF_0580 n=1 Tax=Euwallacea fornicatus TaxID=995702 RepID=UPI00338F3073